MTRCIIGAVLVALSSTVWASGRLEAVKNCKLRYPGNAIWQRSCIDHELRARKAVRKMERKHREIARGCQAANPGAVRGTDWSSTLECVRWELKQARR